MKSAKRNILFDPDPVPYCNSNYTVQCRDTVSGKTGDFLFDTAHYLATGEFKAISPVFGNLYDFYQWSAAHGSPHRDDLRIERTLYNSPS